MASAKALIADPAAPHRVSSIELLFDLVFVLFVSQIARLVVHADSSVDFARAMLAFAVAWWMYGGYAWLASNHTLSRVRDHLVLMLSMVAFLVVTARVQQIPHEHGPVLGIAFTVVAVVHTLLFASLGGSITDATRRLAPFNVSLGLACIASGLVPADWNIVVWALAGLALVGATLVRRYRGFEVNAAHFSERHGIIILIALGESVVAAGTAAATSNANWELVWRAGAGFVLAGSMWWVYFHGDDHKAEIALRNAPASQRARLALLGYFWAHLGMLAGIICASAGLEAGFEPNASEHPLHSALLLAAGTAVFLVSHAWFRHMMFKGRYLIRVLTSVPVLATTFAGVRFGPESQATTLALIVATSVVWDAALTRATHRRVRA